MRMVDPYRSDEIGFRRRFVVVTSAIGFLAGAVFLAFPEIDLEFSRQLQVCPDAKVFAPWCMKNPTIETLRNLFVGVTILIGIAALVGLVRTLREHGKLFGLAQARWWFLLVILGVGPGLVANVMFKDHWGRARPRTVVEFGGTKHFTPPLVFSKECHRNCSFVSGEVSSASVPFFAAALLLPQFRIALLAGGIATGFVAGLIRIAQGGHFLSDVVFAAIFMALTASALHVLLIGLWQRRGLDEALEPYLRPAREALEPRLRPLQGALAPYLSSLQTTLAPYVRSVQDELAPYLRSLQGALAPYHRRLQDTWTSVASLRVANLVSAQDQARP
jgi:lipid A 4'-phosphatase